VAVIFCYQWLVSKAPPDPNNDPVTLGMLLTDKAFAELELGPPADSPEVSYLVNSNLSVCYQ